ncbi:MFS transporter [Natronoflexus pectinivorans]|uniref:GPH family glycoside/pentoside/hexuronide:cation symporter n=1 Tax=Natronoflexus pectinivorans TaxID=682526 RepID=A0A4R2GK60_9BACT|nr:MFS transporter [Natronoflexus pectinivorans]TCO08855.1 GPH family glycoside/pentoside/hexuronide:cation symporter [Natronoflexus pectinivorans]
MSSFEKISIREKIGYAFGDGAANIAWRGVSTFLFIFYTDVFGLNPAAVGLLLLIARSSDGISDIMMGVVGDRTKSKYGKFRPWILWTAIPLGVILSMLFTAPNLSPVGKLIYAYTTYIIFTLVYTANNIPYGALMAVMSGDDKERTSLGSYRMVGAFTGGMLVQGALLFLVAHFGNINPEVQVTQINSDKYEVAVSTNMDVENVNIKTRNGFGLFVWAEPFIHDSIDVPTQGKSFSMKAHETYRFIVTGEENLDEGEFVIIDQSSGYSKAIYLMSVFLSLSLLITFYTTRERVSPPKAQKTDLKRDLKDLFRNRPWIILLLIGLLFQIYNSIKQGIIVIYFTHYLHNQLMAGTYMVALMIASIGGAMATAALARKWGKRNLFIVALIFSGAVNALFVFCGPGDMMAIFTIGVISEFAAAIFPTLFFAMLGDAADYSEYINRRRATGLIYSAGSFSTKFGGGVAGAIIGFVLAAFNYDGQSTAAIQGAVPGIIMLMSWIPSLIALIGAVLMYLYPLNQAKMNEITLELAQRRVLETKEQ